MSPGHLAAAFSQALPDAPSRMAALALKGLDKEARDKIRDADDQLTITKAIRSLEVNQEAMAEYVRGLYNACVLQDGRVEHSYKTAQLAELKTQQQALQVKDVKAQVEAFNTNFVQARTEESRKLQDALATQERILTDRMGEIKGALCAV